MPSAGAGPTPAKQHGSRPPVNQAERGWVLCSHISLDTHKILSGIVSPFAGENVRYREASNLLSATQLRHSGSRARAPHYSYPGPGRALRP